MTPFLLKAALVLLALALVGVMVMRARKHPNRAKDYPDRVRMPKLILLVGALLLAVGVLIGLAAFTADDDPESPASLLPMRIAAVGILIAGALFTLLYRNWYVAPGADAVHFRTILGREKTIVYSDIIDYRMLTRGGQPNLRIRSSDGTTLSLNPALFDMSPLLAAIAFRERTGRWPLRGEAR